MHTKLLKFGGLPPVDVDKKRKQRAGARQAVKEDGLESNNFTTYDHEVKFENIVPNVNICRTKYDDPETGVGVAKGAILADVPLTVPSNTAAATTHAMKKRCDYRPSLKDISSFKSGHEVLMSKFDPLPEIRVTKDLMDEYFSKCDPSKAKRLLEALDSAQWNSEMATKHVFAKQEVLLKDHQAQPRIVYQGTDLYNALTGPVVMELNNRMKQVFSMSNPRNTGNVALYACGMKGEDLGEIMEQARGEPVESDAKNNDGSQPKELRKYEAMFYRKLGGPSWFVREFARTTKIRVWTRYGISGTIEGERWSGETTTTPGNSYVHMAMMQAALERACIKESTNIHGGDDYLGYVVGDTHKFKAEIEKVFDDTGMVAEVVPQRDRHHATFYRKRYIRGTIGCRPVPQFGRVLSKINLRPNRNSQVNDRDYMSGKYLSAAYEHRHVPGIKDILLATSVRLSDNPYLDVRTSKLKEMGGRDNVSSIVLGSQEHSVADFSDFLDEVYGITYDSLFELYERVAQSCVNYCEGWTFVGKDGRVQNKKGNSRYIAPKMCGDTIEALVRADVT